MSLLSDPPNVHTHSLFDRLHFPLRDRADANRSTHRPLESSSSTGVFGSESDSDSSESEEDVADGGDMLSISSSSCLLGTNS